MKTLPIKYGGAKSTCPFLNPAMKLWKVKFSYHRLGY